MTPLAFALIGWALAALVMAGLHRLQRRTRNAGIVDVAWTVGVAVLAIGFAVVAEGAPQRRALVGAMAGLWGARLGFYLWRRVHELPEDGRYADLRQTWGARFDSRLFWFFQAQALWTLLFALPMLIAASNPAPAPAWGDALGLVIFAVSITGTTIADRQLARFRADPRSRGQVCREGLWRYSRHPNYFFEWLHWWAYLPIGLAGPYGLTGLIPPLVMLAFLLWLTGIPPTERRALASRGEAYRDYQRTTSAFIPWFPRSSH